MYFKLKTGLVIQAGRAMVAKLRFILALMVLSLAATQVAAFEGKVAVIDIQRAILKTEYASAKLEESRKQPDVEGNIRRLENLEGELRDLLESYKKNQDVMSDEKKAEEQRRIRDKQTDGQYLTKKLVEAQKEWEQKVVDEVGPKVREVLEEIVAKQEIDMLFRLESGAVLHHDKRYDITDQVTEQLNLRFE